MPRYEWTPPRRNTDDPQRPPLPGMPEAKPPRVKPGDRLYHQSGNEEIWGHLAHADLREHNPFLRDREDYGHTRGRHWRQEEGGYADLGDEMEGDPDRVERRLQRAIHKALPAIAISGHAMKQVLDSGRVKSQFETHTSGGALAPDTRQDVEHRMFGYPHELPAHARPIYGYLTHNPSVQHPGASGYGQHALILHRPRIWHRTSAFIGDSLDDMERGHSAHPVQDFRLSGFPHDSRPKGWRLDTAYTAGNDHPYTEAHYHGGVSLRDVHYAALHRHHDPWGGSRVDDETDELKDALNHHKIPWVHMDRGKPIEWEHHLGRLMETTAKGAHMHHETSKVIGQQGKGRYLIDLGYNNDKGHPQAQVADTNTGELHPPMPKDSILARGYWNDPDFDVSVHDVLPLVTPK